jgi:hypothetical protein
MMSDVEALQLQLRMLQSQQESQAAAISALLDVTGEERASLVKKPTKQNTPAAEIGQSECTVFLFGHGSSMLFLCGLQTNHFCLKGRQASNLMKTRGF